MYISRTTTTLSEEISEIISNSYSQESKLKDNF